MQQILACETDLLDHDDLSDGNLVIELKTAVRSATTISG